MPLTIDAASMRSRYKDTPTFTGPLGGYYGVLSVSPEFYELQPGDYVYYTTGAGDVGFPDRIAARLFGDGNEDLWWVIMLVNGIIDPETELGAGRVLLIPPLAAVQAFLSRS